MPQEQAKDTKTTLTDAESAPIPGPPPSFARRHFWLILAGICLVGLACRLVILREYLTENPMAQNPSLDAETYWEEPEEQPSDPARYRDQY